MFRLVFCHAALLATLNLACGDSGAGSCDPGTLGCACLDGDVCGLGLVCQDGSCVGDGDTETETETATQTGTMTVGSSSATDTTTDTSTGSTGSCGGIGCTCTPGSCDEGLVCADDMCESPIECDPDSNEQNDTEDDAFNLGMISDDDDRGGQVSGVLAGSLDVDWFVYHGSDDFGTVVDPTRNVMANEFVRLCAFAECDAGLAFTVVDCPQGITQTPSPSGRPGCCADGGTEFELLLSCPGSDDSANVYLRIDAGKDGGEPEQCVDYTLTYHY